MKESSEVWLTFTTQTSSSTSPHTCQGWPREPNAFLALIWSRAVCWASYGTGCPLSPSEEAEGTSPSASLFSHILLRWLQWQVCYSQPLEMWMGSLPIDCCCCWLLTGLWVGHWIAVAVEGEVRLGVARKEADEQAKERSWMSSRYLMLDRTDWYLVRQDFQISVLLVHLILLAHLILLVHSAMLVP